MKDTPTRKPGRPPKYTPEVCDKVRELGRAGYCKSEIAFLLDISRDTLYEWMKTHTEFKTAVLKAIDDGEAVFIANLREGIHDKRYNATAAALYANNVYKWRSKEHEDPAVNIANINILQLKQSSTDDLLLQAQEIMKKLGANELNAIKERIKQESHLIEHKD